MHPFFKNNKREFFDNFILPLRPKVYTVVVVYLNGYKKEYQGIEKPWQYIEKVKQNPKVKAAYIK
jgi:hypothetical protein